MTTSRPHLETVADVLARQAARAPSQVAILCEDRRLTYEQLARESNRCARAVGSADVSRGARIAYLGKESEHYYEVFFGCAKSETVLVPINWRLAAGEVDHILCDAQAEVLVVENEYLGLALEAQAQLPRLRLIVNIGEPREGAVPFSTWKEVESDADIQVDSGRDDAIVQLYTSGTTGLPKGVVLAQRSFFAIREGLHAAGVDWLDWHPNDVSLVGIPGFHVAGIWWAMQGFIAGVPNVVLPWFRSKDAAQAIREHKVSTTLIVPAMLHMILSEPTEGPNDHASLRKIAYGGSPISESLLRRGLEQLGCAFVQLYGLTESGNAAVCLPPAEHVVGNPRMRAAGRPLPGVELKVIDREGAEVTIGVVGEICIRTPAVMLEYWGMPAATTETLVDGWLHTGDAGHLDAEGYVFISDRIKDTIIVAGENVYPAEVENALAKHPAVAEVAVIGVPDERWGEAIQAFVVLRAGQHATARELMRSLKGTIADFKIPNRYEFVAAVPRNPSGKILRRILRDQYWSHMERKVN